MDAKTAARVFGAIDLFAEVHRPMIYSEIARQTDIPLSSCPALLQTMIAKGYLYAPGAKAGYYPIPSAAPTARRARRDRRDRTCDTHPRPGTALGARRKHWNRRPDWTNRGDFCADDQPGYANDPTPEQFVNGAQVRAGQSFCLSLPPDYPGESKPNPRAIRRCRARPGKAGCPT